MSDTKGEGGDGACGMRFLLPVALVFPSLFPAICTATRAALELIECPQKIQHASPFSPGVTNDHAGCSLCGGIVALFLIASFFFFVTPQHRD